MLSPDAANTSESLAAAATLSKPIDMLVSFERAASLCSFSLVTIWLATKMFLIPAAAMTSASETLAAVIPRAPKRICS